MRITLDFAAVLSQWPLLAKGVLITLLLTAAGCRAAGAPNVVTPGFATDPVSTPWR